MLPQDLHIHTTFSVGDSAVEPQQTVEMIAFAKHAKIVGISDHFERFMPNRWDDYYKALKKYGIYVGTEVNGHAYIDEALKYDFDYFIYHCWGDDPKDYLEFKVLQESGKPTIVAHPNFLDTDLERIPENSLVEINNRYIWRSDWRNDLTPYINKFRWVFSSDAHQPHWLNQTIARRVGEELGIKETLLFD